MASTMTNYRILIVDDQRDIRDMLSASIKTLGPNFFVIGVPSGEEALLVISTQDIDVLVLDVILPGITGLELLKKARQRFPKLKVVLVTGVSDAKIQREVAEAGADAFFIKPLAPFEFLETLRRLLGIEISREPVPTKLEGEKPERDLSGRLTSLHKELSAITSVLFDHHGRIHAQVGDLPAEAVETTIFPLLMSSTSASADVARVLGSNPPSDLLYFAGPDYDILLAHVSESFALAVFVSRIELMDDHSKIIRTVYGGVSDLHQILLLMGVDLLSESEPVTDEDEFGDDYPEDDAPILDSLFLSVDTKVPETEDVNAYWDSVAENETATGIRNDDVLSYDQALELGLTPDEGDE